MLQDDRPQRTVLVSSGPRRGGGVPRQGSPGRHWAGTGVLKSLSRCGSPLLHIFRSVMYRFAIAGRCTWLEELCYHVKETEAVKSVCRKGVDEPW